MGEYCFTENEDTLFIHQHIGSRFRSRHGRVELIRDADTGALTIHAEPEQPFTLGLRIPRWCKSFTASLSFREEAGYAYFEMREAVTLTVRTPEEVRVIRCSTRVRENAGKVAVTKGPFVYCLEEADNGPDLHRLILKHDTAFRQEGEYLLAEGLRERDIEELYSPWQMPETEEVTLRLIPYHRWANRGENEMSVYMRIV